MVPLGRLVAGSPCSPFHKNFRRTISITLGAFFFIVLLQILHHGSPLGSRRKSAEPYHVDIIEDNGEARTMVTSTNFHPVAIPPGHNKTLKELCASFPHHLLDRIQPVLKTGFTDEPGRMESQMESCSACFEPGELLIFSDLDDTYNGHEIIDVLATLPTSYHKLSKFKPYFEQKRLRDSGKAASDPEALKKIDGWKLDKFKFLPQVEKAWELKPDRDFYVFYETDTYIFWDPLFRFLSTLDPDTPLYLGSASPGRIDEFDRVTRFANGGPGYVISRGAMKRLLHRRTSPTGYYLDPPFAEKHVNLMHDEECCGDSALGYALWLSGTQMQALYPMFAQHPLHHIPFDAMRWCTPLFSLHKASYQDMRNVFQWEFTARSNDYAMRHQDLWDFFKPGSEPLRPNWRNDDRFGHKVEADVGLASKADCEAHCRSLNECFMWTWRGHDVKECIVSEGVMLHGEEANPEEVNHLQANYTAGWIVDKVQKWKDEHKCTDTLWLSHSFARLF